MGLFKNRGRKRAAPRRNTRVWMLRLKKLGIIAVLAGLVIWLGAIGYVSGSFSRMNARTSEWISSKTLSWTAHSGFRVKEILVTGRQRVPAEDILARLNVRQNAPMFGIDIAETQRKLAEVPWVSSVSVSRLLPNRVLVDVHERSPVALWQYQKKLSLIDETGAAIRVDDLSSWRHLPLIVGENAPAHVAELISLLHAEPLLADNLQSASRIGDRRWDIRLKNGLTIKLPEKDATFALRKLMSWQETQRIFEKDIAVVDLRLPEKTVIEPLSTNGTEADKNKKNKST